MSFQIRKANPEDAAPLGVLIDDYMRETYGGGWGGDVAALRQHLQDESIGILLLENARDEIEAFLAWTISYDLHWCMKGGVIVDLYVRPASRGRGAALVLAAELAAEIKRLGGTHLKGGAVETASVHRFYQRIAARQGENEYYVSGRAFRRLAALSGKTVREMVGSLPSADWNFQP
jgi:GNAT superfamily N-acetyltransferase